jgi:predicted RNA-binding protein with PUA-like domain
MDKSMTQNFWLFKSEPDEFSIDDLQKVECEAWNGVRNYQARNFMRDKVQYDDKFLFYHSSCPKPGVAGVGKIVKTAYPDPKDSRWVVVDVQFLEKFKRVVELKELRENPKLSEMLILRKGNRLSITPVKKTEFEAIKEMV